MWTVAVTVAMFVAIATLRGSSESLDLLFWGGFLILLSPIVRRMEKTERSFRQPKHALNAFLPVERRNPL